MQANQSTTQSPPAMVTLTDQAPPSPRRSTISAYPTTSPHTRKNGGNGQCTHLTTTRLYTADFRCVFCMRAGSFGWVYRCTQDRELLLDEDIQNGFAEKLDKFCETLPRSTFPHKRSAAARIDKLSFLNEVSDFAMQSYTPEQLKIVLAQRADVHEQLAQPEYPDFPEAFYQNRPLPPHPNPPPGLPLPTLSPINDNGLKPWFPLPGGECQFKCCHFCRPSLKERSFLSLNGIADGDIPSTSITGFGFHLLGKRPVALVKHVKNLGLRPNPPSPSSPQDNNANQDHQPSSPSSSPSTSPKSKKARRRPLSIGLGIFAQEAAHPSASPDYTRPSTPQQPPTPTSRALPSTPTTSGPGISITGPRPTTPIVNSFEDQALASLPDSDRVNRRHSSYSPSPSPSIAGSGFGAGLSSESSRRVYTLATTTPLPPPTPTEQSSNNTLPITPVTAHVSTSFPTPTDSTIPKQAENASTSTPTPPPKKILATGLHLLADLTPMETNELIQGEFSSEPLEVKDGIAVTEESVELHVADFITQF
ncbi:hypothetical protein VTL71DRAFT_480 [Oculimacula yallundae]|uniref:Uncharacterized protein n=1 Tax=Oculimacula yallundae TaxID=86028 RepID=A0ABR4D065_9HELO